MLFVSLLIRFEEHDLSLSPQLSSLFSSGGMISDTDLKDESRASSPMGLPAEEDTLQRKAIRKLDISLLPIMTMFYLLSFLVCLRIQAISLETLTLAFTS